MSITIEQHAKLQPRIVEVQRLALEFAELGESKVSQQLLQAAVRASRIKPAQLASAAPAKAEKGKGA